MRFLALLSLFLLSACSYDPYHYYYDCEGTLSSGKRYTKTYYAHNKKITDGKFGRTYSYKSQTSLKKTYVSYQTFETGTTWKYKLLINKINNSIEEILEDEDGDVLVKHGAECSLEKTLFKK